MSILELIPEGRTNAISRAQLVKLSGMNDRAVRREIANLKRTTVIICATDGTGYYIPSKDDIEELNRYIKQEEHRASEIYLGIKRARRLYMDYRYCRRSKERKHEET